jgi:tRNA(adenine34) deaminase
MLDCDWSSDVCSSDLVLADACGQLLREFFAERRAQARRERGEAAAAPAAPVAAAADPDYNIVEVIEMQDTMPGDLTDL